MRRYKGKCDIFFDIETQKEMHGAVQQRKQTRLDKNYQMITLASSEDRKHTSVRSICCCRQQSGGSRRHRRRSRLNQSQTTKDRIVQA